jgi:predicted SAM-dependent methyltransferase
MAIRLDVGSGDKPHEGFTGVDLYAEGKDIIKAPMNALPFEPETVDEIYSSHALEHIGKYEIIPTLAEWYRVLKFDGRLTIEVPDLEWCCKNWLKYRSNDWNMDALFGDQSTPGQFHKTGFTRQLMYQYLANAGFTGREVKSTIIFSHKQDCLIFETTK